MDAAAAAAAVAQLSVRSQPQQTYEPSLPPPPPPTAGASSSSSLLPPPPSSSPTKFDRPSSSSPPTASSSQQPLIRPPPGSSQGLTRPHTSAGRLDTSSLSQALPGVAGPSSSGGHGHGQMVQHAHQSSGIRSRITVVCAECKRLKLRCDRRTPCGSCQKRDTVDRCVYTAAASEKVDVQSLHNRLLTMEATVHQLTAELASRPPSTARSAASSSHSHHSRDHPPPPTALVATGPNGSSIVLSLEDVAGVWLDALGVPLEIDLRLSSSDSRAQLPPHGMGWETLFPPAGLFFPPAAESAAGESTPRPPEVTRQLLERLPQGGLREAVEREVGRVWEMWPCEVGWGEWRRRVRGMFRAVMGVGEGGEEEDRNGEEDEEVDELEEEGEDDGMDGGFGAPPRSSSSRRQQRERESREACTSITFYAVVSSAYALGCQSLAESSRLSPTLPHPSSSSSSSSPSDPLPPPAQLHALATSLLALSNQALAVAQQTTAYDLDTLLALRLQCLYKLHDGQPRVAHEVGPEVCRMVGVARVMGLHVDPDLMAGGRGKGNGKGNGKGWTLWEREMRRRVWWDIYYYDLFISDCMGLPPTIDDSTFSCRLPADVDDAAFHQGSTTLPPPTEKSNFAFFIQKCRLAQLVKRVRKRTLVDPSSGELSIDSAAELENEIQAFLASLPPAFQLAADQPIPTPASSLETDGLTPLLVAQRCELSAIATQLILKVYHPFLRRSPTGKTAPHQAVHASVQAAHVLIHASAVLVQVLKHVRPAAYVFYSFGRQVFHAAVIAAHTVIQQPMSLFGETAMRDLERALAIMRDPALATGRGPARGGVEGAPSEAVRVVEMLRTKAELALRGVGAGGAGAGMKRKHEEVDEHLAPGFQMPYVGGAVTVGAAEEEEEDEREQQVVYPAYQHHQQVQVQRRPVQQRQPTQPLQIEQTWAPLPNDPSRTWIYEQPSAPAPQAPPIPRPASSMPPPPLAYTSHAHQQQHAHHMHVQIPDHRPTKERVRTHTHPQVGFRSRERPGTAAPEAGRGRQRLETSAGIVTVPQRRVSQQPPQQQMNFGPAPMAPSAQVMNPDPSHSPQIQHAQQHPEYVGTPYGPQEVVVPFFVNGPPPSTPHSAYEPQGGDYGQPMRFDFNAQHQQQQQPPTPHQAQAFELSPQVQRNMSIYPHHHHQHGSLAPSIPSTPVEADRFNPLLIGTPHHAPPPLQVQVPQHVVVPKQDVDDIDQPMMGGGGAGDPATASGSFEQLIPAWEGPVENTFQGWPGYSFR